jgi:hypothetical protein
VDRSAERRIEPAYFLKDGTKTRHAENDYGLLLKGPASGRDAFDTVVVFELAGQYISRAPEGELGGTPAAFCLLTNP